MPLNKPKSSMLDAGSTAAPQNLGATAAAGTGPNFSFADHVHPLPTPAQIGALSTSQIAGLASTAPAALGASASVGTSTSAARADHVHALPTPAQIGALSTSQIAGLSTLAASSLSTQAIAGISTFAARADHEHLFPTASEVGAIPTTQKGVASGVASLDANARLNAVQMPAISGDVTIAAGTTTASVEKVKGKSVATPTVAGTIAQYDGTDIVWGSAPAGGSGGGGVTLFFNNGTTADTPTTGLPTLTNGTQYKELRKVAEPLDTTITSGILTATYANIAGFITDVNDPKTTEITAGLWDFNLWAQSNDADTKVRASLYKYDGSTQSSTLLQRSAEVSIGLNLAQYVFSLIIPQTTILETDRICVVLEASNTGNGHTVTLSFGGTTPSHTHSTIASVGGSGVVKVVNGVQQSLASKIVNEDVADNAAISISKTTGILPIERGGTGSTTVDEFLTALGVSFQIRPVAARVNLGTGTVSGQTYTVTATGPLPTTIDGTTLVNGDLVAVVQGAGGTLNHGFWVVTNVGGSGVQAVLTRPSWYQNGATWSNGAAIFVCSKSASAQGGLFAFVPTTGTINNWVIGSTGLSYNSLYNRSGNATLGTNTYVGSQVFAGGGPTVSPARFQAGSLLTTQTAHSIEWDGSSLYLTPSTAVRKKVAYLEDGVSVVSSALTASPVYNFDIESFEAVYCTANATVDPIINFRGSSALTINSILEVNKARTVNVMLTNGTTAYKITAVQIDGAAQTVKWLGGSAPSAGNASSIDSYSFTIIKTAASTYTVLGSLVRFA